MNLLFYVPQMAAYGGMERHVCALAAAAAGRGHAVTLLTTSNSLGGDLRAGLDRPGITLRELPAARGNAGRIRKLGWLVREIARVRRQAWDLIYTNGQSTLAALVWQAGLPKTRIVHHHHTAADAGEQAAWSTGFRQVLRRSPELVGCSEHTRNALNSATGRSNARYLPYLTRALIAPGEVSDCAPGGILHFGFMGRLIPEKGIDAICRLSTDPALAGIHWHLHGAGEAYPPGCFGPWSRITCHGAYHDASTQARALLALDALVLLSTHNEGMPLSLIEAMSAGLPWVATDRGGTRELAVSPDNALVVAHPATDPQLRTAMQSMAARIRRRQTSRVAQRQAYDRSFAPAVVSDLWMAFLESRAPAAVCQEAR